MDLVEVFLLVALVVAWDMPLLVPLNAGNVYSDREERGLLVRVRYPG